MDIVGKARKLERKIARSLDAAVIELVGRSEPAPLEIVHAVLDRAEQQIQEAGRGVRVFPFNRVRIVRVAASGDRAARTRFTAVLDGPPSLADRLRERLQSAGCRAVEVAVDVSYATKPGPQWESPEFHVEFRHEPVIAAPTAPAPATAPRLKLTVIAGKAAQRVQTFSGGRIDIGRRSEVLDSKQRVVRTNHVAFDEEGPDANRSVSRRHAHVSYHPGAGEYRLLDERSVHGTSIVRGGRTIVVPAGSRGVRIESGDEIIVGQARLRATLV
jgi:FHA domain